MKVMAIFGAAMLLVGVYLIFAGFFMKRKNEIGTIILAEEEVKKCTDKKGFIAFMYWREILVGGAIILLGLAEIANVLFEYVFLPSDGSLPLCVGDAYFDLASD